MIPQPRNINEAAISAQLHRKRWRSIEKFTTLLQYPINFSFRQPSTPRQQSSTKITNKLSHRAVRHVPCEKQYNSSFSHEDGKKKGKRILRRKKVCTRARVKRESPKLGARGRKHRAAALSSRCEMEKAIHASE